MDKIFYALLSVVIFVSCDNKFSMIQKTVNAVNQTLPAKTWDGQHLESVRLFEDDNAVEFYIQGVGGHKPDSSELSRSDLSKAGIWYIANFMTAYDYAINGEDGEGDSDMYKEVVPLLKLIAGNKIGIRFNLDFREGGTMSIDLSPEEVSRAIKLRKDSFYELYD